MIFFIIYLGLIGYFKGFHSPRLKTFFITIAIIKMTTVILNYLFNANRLDKTVGFTVKAVP
ncbi:uncharacterized protein YqgC (DUF456 family) [Sphingobacterium zeae]|uniref:Uncharacterized protein YqgC (DUF456 family) n=1 Tax=Sphingobacterium zeae TaxID=1776859 RepID=A0ABU0U3N7_9SPHI|nr:uncharacterized protein YqgC (DUF456 family) [Sphingobacterium zeae]